MAPAKVSIILPTYNRARVLKRAIDSVLSQTYPHWELIVMDDGSSDETKDVVKTYGQRVRYFYQPNQGVYRARNAALPLCRNEWIAFLDSDDVWLPKKLEIQMNFAQQYPNVGLWSGDCSVKDAQDRLLLKSRFAWYGIASRLKDGPIENNAIPLLLEGNFIGTSSVLVKKTLMQKAGPFEEKRICQDYDQWIRCTRLGAIGVIASEPLYEKTVAGDNLIRNQIRQCEEHRRILNKHADLAQRNLELRRAYRLALARNQYHWGNACYEQGHVGSAFSKYFEGLFSYASFQNYWLFLKVFVRKSIRFLSFGLVSRKKFFKNSSGQRRQREVIHHG